MEIQFYHSQHSPVKVDRTMRTVPMSLVLVILVLFSDLCSAQWKTTLLSVRRANLAATTAGNFSMFAGGLATGEEHNLMTDAVDIYDYGTDSWSTAKLSAPRGYLAATAVGTKAIFAGGVGSNGRVSNIVDIFDISTKTWSTSTLRSARTVLSAVTLGTKAFFCRRRK